MLVNPNLNFVLETAADFYQCLMLDTLALVARLADVPQVRWKESIKAIAGIEANTDASEGEAWAGVTK